MSDFVITPPAILTKPIIIPSIPNTAMMQQYAWHQNANLNSLLTQVVKTIRKIERDELKLLDKKQPFTPHLEVSCLIQQIRDNTNLSERIAASGLTLCPHLKIFVDETTISDHHIRHMYPFQYIENCYYRIRNAALGQRAGLHARQHERTLKEAATIQKRRFRSILQRHEQVNCILAEFPIVMTQGLSPNWDQDTLERNTVTLTNDMSRSLWGSRSLVNNLVEIQHRIVKGLDGVLIVQMLIYIAGDAHDYSQLIRDEWEFSSVHRRFSLQPSLVFIESLHCYQDHGLNMIRWKNLLDLYQLPLQLYTYRRNGIDYVWRTYPGNI